MSKGIRHRRRPGERQEKSAFGCNSRSAWPITRKNSGKPRALASAAHASSRCRPLAGVSRPNTTILSSLPKRVAARAARLSGFPDGPDRRSGPRGHSAASASTYLAKVRSPDQRQSTIAETMSARTEYPFPKARAVPPDRSCIPPCPARRNSGHRPAPSCIEGKSDNNRAA